MEIYLNPNGMGNIWIVAFGCTAVVAAVVVDGGVVVVDGDSDALYYYCHPNLHCYYSVVGGAHHSCHYADEIDSHCTSFDSKPHYLHNSKNDFVHSMKMN